MHRPLDGWRKSYELSEKEWFRQRDRTAGDDVPGLSVEWDPLGTHDYEDEPFDGHWSAEIRFGGSHSKFGFAWARYWIGTRNEAMEWAEQNTEKAREMWLNAAA
jgi:hypothetical protein